MLIKPVCKIKSDLDEDEERADSQKNSCVVIREKQFWGFEGFLVSRICVDTWSGRREGK